MPPSLQDFMAHEREFGPEARSMIEGLKESVAKAQELTFYKEAMRLETTQVCIPTKFKEIHERVEALRKIGLIVSFTPF